MPDAIPLPGDGILGFGEGRRVILASLFDTLKNDQASRKLLTRFPTVSKETAITAI
jgi:hypothetical protein